MSDNIEGIKDEQEIPKSDNIEITEIHCHECNGYIKFALDKNKNGEHVVICPKCKHEHCRIIKDGIVTGDRWSSRNKDIPSQPIQQNNQPIIQTFFIQVGMDNYSLNGWQIVTVSNDPFLIDSWGQQDYASQQIIYDTHYYGTSSTIYSTAFSSV